MLQDVEDAKSWFHKQGLERRVNIIDLWKDGENEDLEEQTGEHHEEFREMMEQLREIHAADDMTQQVFRDELENEGFDKPVVLTIINALEESAEPRADLIFLKRNTTPDELEGLVEKSIALYLGRISPEDLREYIGGLEKTEDPDSAEPRGLASDLFDRVDRFMQAATRVSIESTGGIARLKKQVRANANMGERHIESIFNPIESNLEELQRYHVYFHMKEVRYEVAEIQNKLDNLMSSVGELARRIE